MASKSDPCLMKAREDGRGLGKYKCSQLSFGLISTEGHMSKPFSLSHSWITVE